MEPTGADGCSTPQVSPTGNGSVRRPGGDLRILLTCCALVMCSSTTLIAVPLGFELPTSRRNTGQTGKTGEKKTVLARCLIQQLIDSITFCQTDLTYGKCCLKQKRRTGNTHQSGSICRKKEKVSGTALVLFKICSIDSFSLITVPIPGTFLPFTCSSTNPLRSSGFGTIYISQFACLQIISCFIFLPEAFPFSFHK